MVMMATKLFHASKVATQNHRYCMDLFNTSDLDRFEDGDVEIGWTVVHPDLEETIRHKEESNSSPVFPGVPCIERDY